MRLIEIVQIAIFGEPDRNKREFAVSDPFYVRADGILPISMQGKHPDLLHQFRACENRSEVVVLQAALVAGDELDVVQPLFLHAAGNRLQNLWHLIGIDARPFLGRAVGFVQRAEVFEVDARPGAGVNQHGDYGLGELLIHRRIEMVRL